MRHLPEIHIETIPHSKQRYDTAGDYYQEVDKWVFKISKEEDPDEEFLTLIHELVEWYLCTRKGIREEDITEFDIEYLKKNPDGDPGRSRKAPYHREHMRACKVERLIKSFLR